MARATNSLPERFQDAGKARLAWQRVVRIMSGSIAAAVAYEDAVDARDLELLLSLERSSELENLQRLPLSDRVIGTGAGYIMPAFTHPSVHGTRFAPPRSYGVWYAAREEETAIAETRYHRERVLRETKVPPGDFDQRVLLASVRTTHTYDLRRSPEHFSDVYHAEDYTAGQQVGALLRAAGADLVAYTSVRNARGNCVAVFRPKCISQCRHHKFLTYRWDGERITTVLTIQRVDG